MARVVAATGQRVQVQASQQEIRAFGASGIDVQVQGNIILLSQGQFAQAFGRIARVGQSFDITSQRFIEPEPTPVPVEAPKREPSVFEETFQQRVERAKREAPPREKPKPIVTIPEDVKRGERQLTEIITAIDPETGVPIPSGEDFVLEQPTEFFEPPEITEIRRERERPVIETREFLEALVGGLVTAEPPEMIEPLAVSPFDVRREPKFVEPLITELPPGIRPEAAERFVAPTAAEVSPFGIELGRRFVSEVEPLITEPPAEREFKLPTSPFAITLPTTGVVFREPIMFPPPPKVPPQQVVSQFQITPKPTDVVFEEPFKPEIAERFIPRLPSEVSPFGIDLDVALGTQEKPAITKKIEGILADRDIEKFVALPSLEPGTGVVVPRAVVVERQERLDIEALSRLPIALEETLTAGFEQLRPGRPPTGPELFIESFVAGAVTAIPGLPAFVFSVVTKPVETGKQFVEEFFEEPIGFVGRLAGAAFTFKFLPLPKLRVARAPRAEVSVFEPIVRAKAEVSPFIELRQFDIFTGKKVKIVADIETKFPVTKEVQKLFGTLREKKPGEFIVDLTGAGRVVKGLRDPTRFEIGGKITQLADQPVFKPGKIKGLADLAGEAAVTRTRADLAKISRDLEQATFGGKRLPSKISKIESLVLEEGAKPITVGAVLERQLLPRGRIETLFGEQVAERVVTEIPGGVRVQELVKGVATEPQALKQLFKDLGIRPEDVPTKAFRTEADLLKFFETKRPDIDPGFLIKELRGTTRVGRGKIPVTDLDKVFTDIRKVATRQLARPKLTKAEASALRSARAAARTARKGIEPITAPPELMPRGVVPVELLEFDIPITVPALRRETILDTIQSIKSETILKRKQAQELIPGLKLGRVQAIRTEVGFESVAKEAQKTLTATATAQAQAQIQATAQAQMLMQQPVTRLRQEPRLRPPTVPRVPRLRRLPPFLLGDEDIMRPRVVTKRPREFYDVFLKPVKTKKFIRANREPLLRSEAQDLGSFVSDTSLSAAYRIRKKKKRKKALTRRQETKRLKRKLQPPAGYGMFTAPKFREFRISRGRRITTPNNFIEKAVFRLDTRGEVNKITAARRIAQLRKANPVRKKRVKKHRRKRR